MKILKVVLQLCFLLNLSLMVSCKQNNNISIKGEIRGLDTKMVYFYNNYPVGSPPIDSTQVLNNKFEFSYHPDTLFQPHLVFLNYIDKNGKRQGLGVVNPYKKTF